MGSLLGFVNFAAAHRLFCNVGFDSPKFSIELHHGGFFTGKGNNLAYLDEKLSLFDNLDRNTFCNDMIDHMLQLLIYALDQLEIVLWCPRGKTVANLVPIDFELDCLKMARASMHSKVLVLFVNHVKRSEEDDIAYRAGPELPPVILSPISKDKLRHMKSESTEGIVDNAENSEKNARFRYCRGS